MSSFLQGLGSFAGGLAPGVSALADQQSNTDFGNALAQIYGAQPQQQGGSGPLGSIMSALGLSPAPMNAPQPAPQQLSPVSTVAQGGRMPPIAQPTPVLGQQQPQQTAPAPSPQQVPQPAPQPPQPRQGPPLQPQQPQGALDLPTLVKHLVANGVSGHRLGEAVARFTPLLNAQGLAQYRNLGLQLREESQRNLEADRAFNRDPSAQGSRAQSRVAGQDIAERRMQAIQERFKTRMDAATEKLKAAKTDKEARDAKSDLDKVSADLKSELQSELNILNTPGTSPEAQAAAMKSAAAIRQQLEDATSAAVAARRNGGANGDQVGGAQGGAKPAAKPAEAAQPDVAYGPDGKAMKYKGTGDRSDPKNWAPADGGQ